MRTIDADELLRHADVFVDHALARGGSKTFLQFAKAWMAMEVEAAPTVRIQADTSCQGCLYRGIGRYQKCSTCRRNQNLKDNYRPE